MEILGASILATSKLQLLALGIQGPSLIEN